MSHFEKKLALNDCLLRLLPCIDQLSADDALRKRKARGQPVQAQTHQTGERITPRKERGDEIGRHVQRSCRQAMQAIVLRQQGRAGVIMPA